MTGNRIVRIRREPRRRSLIVVSVEPLGSAMLRVWLTGEDLADFESDAPDDHVKLFFPEPGSDSACVGRDYTPRVFDASAGVLAIDFALHGSQDPTGPATRWALTARPGDEIQVGGPRGSTVVADEFAWYLLVGDMSAVPAIGRRLEEVRPEAFVHVMLLVGSEVVLPTLAERHRVTVERVGAHGLADAIGTWRPPVGDGFVWIAAEAAVARGGRDAALARGWPREWLKASGYWRVDAPGTHTKFGE